MALRKSPSPKRRAGRITAKQIEEAERWLGPMRKPDWRWEAATKVAVASPADLTCVDPDVVAAGEFLRAFTSCSTDEDRAAVRAKWPTINQAKAVFDCESLHKWELEAWLMAGLTDRGIANRCKIPTAVVGAYERLFFARREYLGHREDLAQKLFGAFLFLTFGDEEVGRFWHYLGLVAPHAVLRDYITSYHAAWQPGTPHLLSVYLKRDAPVSLSMQAFIAIMLLPGNTRTAPIFFESHLGIIEAECETDPARKKEKIDQIKRTMVEFTRGYLAGKTAEELLLLLRYPPSMKRAAARMRALVAEGHFVPFLTAQGIKILPVELCELPNVVGSLPPRESGASEGAWHNGVGTTRTRRQ